MSNPLLTVPERLRQQLRAAHLKLPRLNYFVHHLRAIQRQERPLAQSPETAFVKWSPNAKSAEWPCTDFANLAAAFSDPLYGPLWHIWKFCAELAVVEHLYEGRDVRNEIEVCFGTRLPAALIVLAADAGRVGVLRRLGYRPGRNDISADDLRYANRLLAIAGEVHGEILEALATHAIAWPCQYCGHLTLNMTLGFCSKRCVSQCKRREAYLRSADPTARRSRKL
ncbi:MAG: hypothetical protein IPP47_14345 [Bryobacterales bacterium]|nr:hypothetical protein [Bryobacterales bacterium]